MDIAIVSDVICPWCFIGKQHLEQALHQVPNFEVRIRWLPFFLNPDMPATGMPRQAYLNAKFGGESNARAVYGNIQTAGQQCGINFNFAAIQRTPNTLNAHRLLYWAEDLQHQLAGELFRRYFLEGEDIGDQDILVAAGEAAGLDGTQLRQQLQTDQDQDSILQIAHQAHTLGVSGVPFFILDNRYTLSGAQPPDVLRQAMEHLQSTST